MPLLDVTCSECGEITRVTEYPATRWEPGDCDPTDCSTCGAPLDFDTAEPPDLDAEEFDRNEDLYMERARGGEPSFYDDSPYNSEVPR